MKNQDKSPAYAVPLVYSQVEKHPVFPEVSHDESARYNFLASLNRHLTSAVFPGNKVGFERYVKPQYERQTGRSFKNWEEVGEALSHDPYYQFSSALRRSALEMGQQASRSLVLRQLDDLARKANRYNEQRPDTLELNPSVSIPRYLSLVDHHGLPGSYYTEFTAGDVANAANYDAGRFLNTAGKSDTRFDGAGRSVCGWLKQNYPDFSPRRILDIGCGVGHNTLPLARAFPEAEVVGIDVSAPMLRYAHARATALGVDNIRFVQANAEELPFADESFDWVQSTMFLHETARSAMDTIIQQIYRVLHPAGLTLHIDQPQHTAETPLFEQFMSNWDAYNANDPFLLAIHDLDWKEWLLSAGFGRENLLQFRAPSLSDTDDSMPGNYALTDGWHVFGAFKK